MSLGCGTQCLLVAFKLFSIFSEDFSDLHGFDRMYAYFFDIDGTLLNSGQAGQSAMEEVLRTEFGVTVQDCDISYAGRTDCAIVGDLLNWYDLGPMSEILERFQAAYYECLPTHLGNGKGRVLPGVEKLLDELNRESNERTGLLTGNFQKSGWMKVRHFAIDHHFSFGAFGDEHPNRDDVARRAHELSTDLHEGKLAGCWVIGDTPADITCARAIGARVLAVATGHYDSEELAKHDPDAVYDDLSDTSAILNLLLGDCVSS